MTMDRQGVFISSHIKPVYKITFLQLQMEIDLLEPISAGDRHVG